MCSSDLGIELGVLVVVLAQGIAHPVDIQEEASAVGVVQEYDSEEIVYLAFVSDSHRPDVGNRRNRGQLAVASTYASNFFIRFG